MIVEETGEVCTIYADNEYDDMTNEMYLEMKQSFIEKTLRCQSLIKRPSGEDIIDLINYTFGDMESCIVCKSKVYFDEGDKQLYYKVYGRGENYYHDVWTSMLNYALERNKKLKQIAKKMGKPDYEVKKTVLLLTKKGEIYYSPNEFSSEGKEDYNEENMVFSITFKYNDFRDWLKEQWNEWLKLAISSIGELAND